ARQGLGDVAGDCVHGIAHALHRAGHAGNLHAVMLRPGDASDLVAHGRDSVELALSEISLLAARFITTDETVLALANQSD
ncbi:hypothetical protein RA277_30445, partial [Pseudomonas syringae pv. tagetis]